jgi:hypothetical protein
MSEWAPAMNEVRELSPFDARLAKAQQLFERGKQRRGLAELWGAEVLARGDTEAIREMLNLTSALGQRIEPKHASRLVELVAALEQDASQASESSPMGPLSPPSTEPTGAFYLGLVLSLLLAAGASGFILLIWFIAATTCPCSPHDFICIFGDQATSGAGAHLAGAAKGLLYGGTGLLLLTGCAIFRFRTRLTHPFLTLNLGFPLFYGALLLSIWGVARGVWGPTTC